MLQNCLRGSAYKRVVLLVVWLAIFMCCLSVGCQYLQRSDELLPQVVTDTGITINFSNQGEIRSVLQGAYSSRITTFMRAHSGWLVEDKVSGLKSDFRGILKPVQTNVLSQAGAIDGFDLELNSRYEADGEIIRISMQAKSLVDRDRALTLTFRLPVYDEEWTWQGGIAPEDNIMPFRRYESDAYQLPSPDSVMYMNEFGGRIPLYPFACVSNLPRDMGLSLAIPPDNVIPCDFFYESQLFCVSFRVGLSPEFRTPNETEFSFIIFRQNPQRGCRSTLEQYLRYFSSNFLPDSSLSGLMRTGGAAQPVDPQNFGILIPGGRVHEAGTIEEYKGLAGFDQSTQRGERIFPYMTAGQSTIYNLASFPSDADQALAAFDAWNAQAPVFFQSPARQSSFQSEEQLKSLIRNSNLYTPGQEPVFEVRDADGSAAITFPLNPNPALFRDSDSITVAKYNGAVYAQSVISGMRESAGIFLDGISIWGRYYNFRRQHFRFSNYPLSFHPDSGFVCILNSSSHAEYLDSLRSFTRDNGIKLFLGGVRPGDYAAVFRGDYIKAGIGMEELKNDRYLRWYRMMAGPKPVFVEWDKNAENLADIESQLDLCVGMGYFPAFSSHLTIDSPMDSIIVHRRRVITPILNVLNRVKWQPVTLGSIANKDMILERFGENVQDGLYYTVVNPHPAGNSGVISISLRDLKLPANTILEDAFRPGQRLSIYIDNQGNINTSATLRAYGSAVIRVTQ